MNIGFAEMFARGAHIGQKYNDRPFFVHLRDVVRELTEFGYDPEEDELMMCAAYLHDTIEDTPTTYQDISTLFGSNVAELVWAVTDERGRNRKERRNKTSPKTFADRNATILKLADLSANVKDAIKESQRFPNPLRMYMREWDEIKAEFEAALIKRASHLLGHLQDLDWIVLNNDAFVKGD